MSIGSRHAWKTRLSLKYRPKLTYQSETTSEKQSNCWECNAPAVVIEDKIYLCAPCYNRAKGILEKKD